MSNESNAKKVVIVSGGSRGLGRAIVQGLLESSYIVGTFSRSKSPFIEELQAGPFRDVFHWEGIDGTAFDDVAAFVKRFTAKHSRLDGLVNNAGVAPEAMLSFMHPNDISNVLKVNLEGAIRLAQACVRPMMARGSGAIINVSSIMGVRGYSGLAAYSTTKAGLDGLTRSLARELGGRHIRVNSIAPGYIVTDMSSTLSEGHQKQIVRRTPLGRLGTCDDVVGVVKFLFSDDARFITGQTLVIDGGLTC